MKSEVVKTLKVYWLKKSYKAIASLYTLSPQAT
jgi:hypothetical protein